MLLPKLRLFLLKIFWYICSSGFTILLIFFTLSYNPIIQTFILLLLRILIYFLISASINAWFGVSIVLIFSGGIIIILLYITSLNTNIKFTIQWWVAYPWAFFNILLLLTIPSSLTFPMENYNFHLVFMFNGNNYIMIYLLITIILFTLVLVVKYAEYFKGRIKKNF